MHPRRFELDGTESRMATLEKLADVTKERNGAGVAPVIARVVVWGLAPLWILAGAVLKLLAGTPANLPSILLKGAGAAGLDLMFLLRYSIGVELAAVGLVYLLPRLARWIEGALLGVFLLILAGDLLVGASSCGCFGGVEVHPAVMLVVDGTLLLGVLLAGRFGVGRGSTPFSAGWVGAALIWVAAAFAASFFATMPDGAAPAAAAAAAAPVSAAASAPALPSYYLPEYATWIGKPWRDLEIAGWVRGAPADLDQGMHFLVFYRKDCPHCHDLLELHFQGALPYPTTVVAVPDRGGFPASNVFPMPCTECGQAELPAGVDWFMQTPVVVRLEDGVVKCAAEVDPSAPECLEW